MQKAPVEGGCVTWCHERCWACMGMIEEFGEESQAI